jgi:hypothetical protein
VGTQRFAAAAVVAFLISAFGVSTALAEAASAVEIDIVPTSGFPCFFQCGTWTASGAINGSGTYQVLHAFSAPPDRPFGATGPYFESFSLTDSQGSTFTINAQERATAADVSEGVWELQSGTGTYAAATGHGTSSFNLPPIVLVLTGVANIG